MNDDSEIQGEVEPPELTKKRVPLSELQKAGRSDWIDYLAPVSLVCFGFVAAFCCGGIPMIGDYIGPPEGLAESNRGRLQNGILLTLPGLAIVGVGIWLLVKCIRKR